jgi:hypothetical protein
MRHFVITITAVVAIAALTCAVAFHLGGDPAVKEAVAKGDAMAWLRTDFQLTDSQFEKIKQLHDSYSIVCEDHCRAIMEATRERDELKAKAADAAMLAIAEQNVEKLRRICENAIAAHVRQCAALMSPESGQRYLALVLPKIVDFDHQAPPDLQLNTQHGHR